MELGLNFERVVIATTAGASPGVLSAAAAGKFNYLHALHARLSTTATLTVQSLTTSSTADLTGAIPYLTKHGPDWPFDARREASLRSQLGGNLQVVSAAAVIDGFAIVSQSTPDT